MKPYARGLVATFALIVAGPAFKSTAWAQASLPGCQLAKEAELPLTEHLGRYFVEADINSTRRQFLVDSGSEKSALAPDTANALGLPFDHTSAQMLRGAGETLRPEYPRVVESIRLGTAEWTGLRLPTTGPETFTRFAAPDLAGILGADVLSRYDVEFDFPRHMMTLYTAQNCLGRFAPWHGGYQSYSPDYTQRHRFLMDVSINGHPMHAVLDTGARMSLLGKDAAMRAGVDDVSLANDRSGAGRGVAGIAFTTYLHRFETVQIGARVFRNVKMTVSDSSLSPGIDMLLGMDFMKWQRVWLSYSTGWVFMQRNTTPVNDVQAASTPVAPSTADTAPLDAAGQLQEVYASGVAWAGLPNGPIPQFSSHSHITYRTVPHIAQ